MSNRSGFLAFFAVLALACAFSMAADPNPLQDFCVAVDEPENGVYVNGKFCKNPNLTTSDDFFFSGILNYRNTSNPLGSTVTHVFIDEFPGVNTLGISMARIDYGIDGLNPPHLHARASEILLCLEGTLYVGFVASNQNDNRLFTKILTPGEAFVFPIGMIHFQLNIGKTRAVALASFGGQSPAVTTVANALFNSDPAIEPKVLGKALQLDVKQAQELLDKSWYYN